MNTRTTVVSDPKTPFMAEESHLYFILFRSIPRSSDQCGEGSRGLRGVQLTLTPDVHPIFGGCTSSSGLPNRSVE